MDHANLPPMLSPKPWNADAVLRLMAWLLLAWGAANFLGFPVQYFCGSSLLQTNDLVDARGLARKLQPRRDQDAVAAWLYGQCAPETRRLVETAPGTNAPTTALVIALTNDLNRLLTGPPFYDAARFRQVELRGATRALLEQKPAGRNLLRLHRRLLEDAFPKQIRSTNFVFEVSPEDRMFYLFLVTTPFIHLAVLVLVTRFLRRHHLSWGEFLGLPVARYRLFSVGGLVTGAAVLMLLTMLTILLNKASAWFISLLGGDPQVQVAIQLIESADAPVQRWFFGLTTIVAAPVVEEIFFRGLLYPTLKEAGLPRLAWWGTSALFALIHFNLMTFVPLFFFAVALVWLYEQTDTLLAPILAHAFFNAVNFLLLIFQPELQQFLERLHERI